jgi:ABC-type molybdate transport system substrate-binding protein
MNPLRHHWVFVLACMILTFGCANQDRLVVYADPWLAEFADSLCQEFKVQHPETEIHLKALSSEVIAQHIRFGQPVDVFLCFGSEWLQQPEFRSKVGDEVTLAGSQVVELVARDSLFASKRRSMRSEGYSMMEASDRPMRRYIHQAGYEAKNPASSILIANFQQQAEDYLVRGWVAGGYMPLHFANVHADRFEIVRRGPVIPNAFTAILLSNAPQPALAKSFFMLTTSEKSIGVLGKLGFLP